MTQRLGNTGDARREVPELRVLLRSSLERQRLGRPVDGHDVDAIERAYRGLPRAAISLQELRDLKFLLQYWRFKSHQSLLQAGTRPRGLFPEGKGPARVLKIPPVKRSPHAFEIWSRDDSLSIFHYETREGGLRYAGLELRPGDILVADCNVKSGGGLFSSITAEPRIGSHLGQLAFLEAQGRTFPAVIEIHEGGLRAVPLNSFLSPHFVSYVEIFRPINPPRGWEARLNEEALGFLGEPRRYNLWGSETDPRSLTCTTVALHLLQRTGAPVPVHRSQVAPGKLASNLDSLGFTAKTLLMPVDFVRDPGLEFVGAIDFLAMPMNVMNELLGSYVAGLLASRDLEPGRLPFRFRMNRWALSQIERRTAAGLALLRWHGFDESTLPAGPPDVIALFTTLEPYLRESAEWLSKKANAAAILGRFHAPWSPDDDDRLLLSALEADEQIRCLLDQAHERLRAWFSRD